MLCWAAKTGSAAVIDYLLAHHDRPVELELAVRIAIADGHIHCLESLLVVGPSLTKFLEKFSPGAPASSAPLRIIWRRSKWTTAPRLILCVHAA